MTSEAATAAEAPRVRRARASLARDAEIKRIGDFLSLDPGTRAGIIEAMTPAECAELSHNWSFWARPDQAPPPGDWIVWLILAGRGAGKTRAGAEAVRRWSATHRIVNLIGPTADDVRDVMVLGESGILKCCRRDERPRYLASAGRLEWPNGAVSLLFSAEEPDRLRGKQHMKLWLDELAAWRRPEAFDQAMLGLRLGDRPQMIVTTTPRPTRIIKELGADKDTIVTRGSTFDNKGNLAHAFLERITKRYEGRAIGRQELFAEIIEEAQGALWSRTLIERQRIAPEAAPRELAEVVVAVDPPARSGANSDECGLIVAGKAPDGRLYVLADLTSQGDTPAGWAARVGALSRLSSEPRRRRSQQRRRHGRGSVAPGGAQSAGTIGHRDPRQVPARRADRRGLRTRPRLPCRGLREARGPALRADARLRPARRGLFPRLRRCTSVGDRRPAWARQAGVGGDDGLLGGAAVARGERTGSRRGLLPQLCWGRWREAPDGVWPAASTQVALHDRHREPVSIRTCFPNPIRRSAPPSPLRGEGEDDGHSTK
jgi:phage terminase large subunit-like protein